MTIQQALQRLAARMGFHVVRNYQNPAHTLLGLKRYDFRTILDVGANSGQFAREMSASFPHATFHCFEPVPAAFDKLSAWASGRPTVHAVPIALGERADTIDMNVHTDHTPSSSLLATTSHCEAIYPFTAPQSRTKVKVERLDDYVAKLPSPPAQEILLKLDVQGYEASVLRGATRTLANVRACLLEVSIDPLYAGQSTFAEIIPLLQVQGLSYAGNFAQCYGQDGRVISFDATFVRP